MLEQLVGIGFEFLVITEGMGGCRVAGIVVINVALVVVVVIHVVECGLMTFQHSHMTLLI